MKKGFQFYIKLYYKMATYDHIKTAVQSVFSDIEYVVEFIEYPWISCTIYTKDNSKCVTLDFYKYIEVRTLDKCGKSGTDSLSKVNELVKKLQTFKQIKLYDGSTISKCGIEIRLAYIKILTTGKSWYNSQGYFSRNYDSEFENNRKKIDMKLTDFLDEVYATNLKISTESERKKCKSEEDCELVISEKTQALILEQQLHKDKRLELFHYVETITVIEFFGRIWEEIKAYKLCDATIVEKCKWLSKTIDFIYNSKILQYDPNLIKSINTEKSGGKNKRKTSKNKNSKQKKTGLNTRSNNRRRQNKKSFTN